jgi:hypothetical protein
MYSYIYLYTVYLAKVPTVQEENKCFLLPNAVRFPSERYFLEVSHLSSICPSDKSNMQIKMSMQHWWNEADKAIPKY